MKTIGLLGGTTWLSTIDYYKILNQETNRRLGKNHTAKVILYSINFEEAMQFKKRNDFEGFKNLIVEAAKKIENAGADCLLLGANTIHMFADQVIENIQIPLIHIADDIPLVPAKHCQDSSGSFQDQCALYNIVYSIS